MFGVRSSPVGSNAGVQTKWIAAQSSRTVALRFDLTREMVGPQPDQLSTGCSCTCALAHVDVRRVPHLVPKCEQRII
jgi:hypothetical protein